MNPRQLLTRRDLLRTSGLGFGGLALTYLLNTEALAADAAAGAAWSCRR